MLQNNRDFLFLFDATNCNPNGDPDQENKPRFDYETHTLLVSDVRRKRDIRDFLANKGQQIFVSMDNGKKVTMEARLKNILTQYNVSAKADEDQKINVILDNMVDIRMFGSAMAIGGITKTFTGPIQFTWGYSLHPVDLVKSNAIVTIMNDDNSTFGKVYKAHYALIAHSGSMNKFAAQKTRLTEEDADLMPKALVQSMMNCLTDSKIGQEPLLYLEVVYDENFDGYLGDLRRFLQVTFHRQTGIRSLNDLEVDFTPLCEAILNLKNKGYINCVRMWRNPLACNLQNLPEAQELDLLKPLAF
jgi:CRISPR-associated protein Csh2